MIENSNILQGHNSSIYKIKFDANTSELFSVGGDGWLVTWDWKDSLNGQLIAKVEGQIFSLALNSKYFYVGTFSGDLYIIDRSTSTVVYSRNIHAKGLYDIVLTDTYYYTVGGDGKIRKWDLESFELVQEIQLSSKALRCAQIDLQTLQLAVAGSDGNIYILDLNHLYLNKVVSDAHGRSVFSMLFLDDHLLSGGMDALLKVWDTSQWQELESINAHWFTINSILDIGEQFVTASRDKSIRFWSKQDYSPISSIKWGETENAHVNSVNSLAYSKHDNVLFSASDDRSIHVWWLEKINSATQLK